MLTPPCKKLRYGLFERHGQKGNFSDVHKKNDFYAEFGKVSLPAGKRVLLDQLDAEKSPEQVIALAVEAMASS
jgi:hypothetical protein